MKFLIILSLCALVAVQGRSTDDNVFVAPAGSLDGTSEETRGGAESRYIYINTASIINSNIMIIVRNYCRWSTLLEPAVGSLDRNNETTLQKDDRSISVANVINSQVTLIINNHCRMLAGVLEPTANAGHLDGDEETARQDVDSRRVVNIINQAVTIIQDTYCGQCGSRNLRLNV